MAPCYTSDALLHVELGDVLCLQPTADISVGKLVVEGLACAKTQLKCDMLAGDAAVIQQQQMPEMGCSCTVSPSLLLSRV